MVRPDLVIVHSVNRYQSAARQSIRDFVLPHSIAVIRPRISRVCRDQPAASSAASDRPAFRPDNPEDFSLRQDAEVGGCSGTHAMSLAVEPMVSRAISRRSTAGESDRLLPSFLSAEVTCNTRGPPNPPGRNHQGFVSDRRRGRPQRLERHEGVPVHQERLRMIEVPTQRVEDGEVVGVDVAPVVQAANSEPACPAERLEAVARAEDHHALPHTRKREKC